jgi:glycosyltransferase involved in cell wall biosynthesis
MRKQLEKQAQDLGISDSVTFLGSRPHNEVALWMNAADCLCLPSRSEGMPNVVIEALASGLPVVAADVGGVRELLENERECRLIAVKPTSDGSCPSGSSCLVPELAKALKEVLELDIDRAAISGRNRNRFSWRKQARAILNLIVSSCVTGQRR